MPSKKDRVIDLVKEKGPIGDEDIYRGDQTERGCSQRGAPVHR